MIRYLLVVVDLSRAAGLTDMRPMRSAVMAGVIQRFIRAFFDENPLSQLGIVVLRNGVAEKLTELSSSPVRACLIPEQTYNTDDRGYCTLILARFTHGCAPTLQPLLPPSIALGKKALYRA